jgi:hypothetical protein
LLIGYSIISILPPIPTAGMTKNDLEMLMEKTRSVMSEAYMKTTDQALAHTASSVINGKKCN